MVYVSHCLNDFEIKNKADDEIRFILTNKKGGYFCVSNKGKSRYDGMFFFKDDMYKIIESIIPINTGKVKEIKNKFYEIERKSDVVEKVSSEVKVYTEEDHLSHCSEEIKSLYDELKKRGSCN